MAEIKGLGDIVERVAYYSGIGTIVKGMMGENCGCQARRKLLNAKIPIIKGRKLNGNSRRQVLKSIKPFKGNDYQKQEEIVGSQKIIRNVLVKENEVVQEDVDRLVLEYNRQFNANVKEFDYNCKQCKTNAQIKRLLIPLVALLAEDSQKSEDERIELPEEKEEIIVDDNIELDGE